MSANLGHLGTNMRSILIVLALSALGGCATLGQPALADLAPVFAAPGDFAGRRFDGEVFVVNDPISPHVSRVEFSMTPEGSQRIEADEESSRRLRDYYRLRQGHHVRIQAIIRGVRIIVTEADSPGRCQLQDVLELSNVRVLSHVAE